MPTASRPLGLLALGALLLVWNVLMAGRIATARGQRPGLVEVSGLCGLFIVPGAIIAVAANWASLGRTISLLGWIWPVTLGLFVAQAILAVRHRRVSSLVTVPMLLLNLVLFVAAVARYAGTRVDGMPVWAEGIAATVTSVLGLGWGPGALGNPLALQLPILVPAGPSRVPGGSTLRVLLAAGAGGFVVLSLLELPASTRAVASYERLMETPLRERPRGDLSLGLRVFPELDRAPTRLAIVRDLPLADTLGAQVVAVTLTPGGASAVALDSLADVLADVRADSVRLAVALAYDANEGERFRADPVAARDRRLAVLDQVVRRVRPDVVFPAVDPAHAGAEAIGHPPATWWIDYHRRASRLIHTVRPRTRVGLMVGATTSTDSVLHAWGATADGIDVIGWSFAPGFRGGAELRAAQRVAGRWMAGRAGPYWVAAVRSWPTLHGERAQQQALLGTLAWASGQPRVEAVVVDGAGDHDVLTGLQRADGRVRPATTALAAAHRALREGAVAMR